MPRQARLDAPGNLHHVMIREIKGKRFFRDTQDRKDFVTRFGVNGGEWGRAKVCSWLYSVNVPATGIFKAYIVFLSREKRLIASGSLPELISSKALYTTNLQNLEILLRKILATS